MTAAESIASSLIARRKFCRAAKFLVPQKAAESHTSSIPNDLIGVSQDDEKLLTVPMHYYTGSPTESKSPASI